MRRYARPRVLKRLRAVVEPKKGPEAFEPPKYLASLIASINDGAKAAQTGALFFAFIGLYLLAVAFSTTDEDLLRESHFAIIAVLKKRARMGWRRPAQPMTRTSGAPPPRATPPSAVPPPGL